MSEEISARQKALKQIWSTSSLDDLLVLVACEPAARDPDLMLELRNQSDACAIVNPRLAERLRHMADGIEQIHTSVNRFAAIEGMADLIALYKEFSFCWTGKFNRILGAFWVDALQGEQVSRKDGLRRALCFLRDVYVAVRLLMGVPRPSGEPIIKALKENPLLCNPDFHTFLYERARFAASHNDPSGQAFWQMLSFLRDACKTLRAVTQVENAEAGKGPIRVRLPAPPELAELWFFVSEEFSAEMGKVAANVNAGTQALEAGIEEALRIGRRAGAKPGSGDALVTAAFLEHLLLIASGGVIQKAVDSYRSLLDSGQYDSSESGAISLLRYSKALVNHWQPLNEPLARFSDAVALIDRALPSVDVNVSPRLTRDLFFARARLLENIGIWQPSAYESAAEDYSRGLAVRAVAHELDARGRALTDYANTLKRIPATDPEEHDRKIIDIYKEAVAALDAEEHPLGRGLALNAYAAHLNESTQGEHARNQESALAMAQEAVDLIERARGMDLVVHSDYVLRALASAYLTKCNVLRGREYGDYVSSNQVAREALRTAGDRLRGVLDNQLRGIILLNLGHVNMDLYEATEDPPRALEASYAYDEAEKLLQPYPRDFSKALLGKAMLVSEVPQNHAFQDIEKSLAATRRAIAILESSNDREALARAWFGLGELQLLRAHPDDYDGAIHAFTRAQVMFLDSGSQIMAIAATRRAAAVKVRQFKDGDPIERVREAKELLISATKWIDEVWQQSDTVEWRYTVSDRFAGVYAEIAWCQATLRDPIQDLAFAVARAKGREFMAHLREVRPAGHLAEGLAEYLDQLRVEMRLAEMSRWRAEKRAEPDRNLDETLGTAHRKLQEISAFRRLLLPRPSLDEGSSPIAAVESFLRSNPAALISDITVCRWGTVVTLFGGADTGSFAGVNVRILPVDSATVQRWLSDWMSSYVHYLEAPDTDRDARRKDWADRTGALLAELGRQLMQPILVETPGDRGAVELVIASGILAGFPLHAAPLGNGRCVAETVGSVVYVPNIAILPPEDDSFEQPATAMCVVSDPKDDLPSAAGEAASVAVNYQKRGVKVELLAQVGSAVGRRALYKRGVTGTDGMTVLDRPPTPRQVSLRLPDCDHFFYAGHGTSADGQSGLLLVDDEGHEKLFTEEDVLAIPALRRRPLIVLSACETATGGRTASAELFDFATSLLRIGARFVVGSLWMVMEDCAETFTTAFYAALAQTNKPSLAYGIALKALKKHREAAASAGSKLVPLDHPIYWAPFIAMRGG